MWWLGIPVAVALGKLIYDSVKDDTTSSYTPPQKTILEKNFERLRGDIYKVNHKRKIAILGQPGAGKSSLLKKVSNGKVTPTPIIGVQTDATTWADSLEIGLLSFWDNHVFADVPGYDTTSHPTSIFMSNFPFGSFDKFILVVNNKIHKADEQIYCKILSHGKPISIVRCFSDSVDESERSVICTDIKSKFHGITHKNIIFVSNRTGEGIREIAREIH